MDINEQDRAALNAKRCPDCGQTISTYFFERNRPWCKACDVWFEFCDSGWVIRNVDATHQYNMEWLRISDRTEGFFA
jgi:hypothetical protein